MLFIDVWQIQLQKAGDFMIIISAKEVNVPSIFCKHD